MSATHPRPRRGTTLVELVVVMAVLATVTGLVGLAFVRRPDAPESAGDRIAAARAASVRAGRATSIAVVAGPDSIRVVALPDGSVVGAERAHVDRLSGRPVDAAR